MAGEKAGGRERVVRSQLKYAESHDDRSPAKLHAMPHAASLKNPRRQKSDNEAYKEAQESSSVPGYGRHGTPRLHAFDLSPLL